MFGYMKVIAAFGIGAASLLVSEAALPALVARATATRAREEAAA